MVSGVLHTFVHLWNANSCFLHCLNVSNVVIERFANWEPMPTVFVSFRFVSIDRPSDLLVEVDGIAFHLHKVPARLHCSVLVGFVVA